jgi:two-component system phosphate regulon response regulator PhoB
MADAKILIVEDDPIMADTIASMLELFGYETAISGTAQSALEMIAQKQPALIVLDLNLPGGMTGIDICRQVKARPETQHTPVIIVSAESGVEAMEAAQKAGAARYLVKPIGIDDLEKAIAETLSQGGNA